MVERYVSREVWTDRGKITLGAYEVDQLHPEVVFMYEGVSNCCDFSFSLDVGEFLDLLVAVNEIKEKMGW